MGTLTYPYTLTAGAVENVNHLNSNLTAVSDVLNGSVDADNLAAGGVTGVKLATAVQAAGGFNGASTRRGKTIIATEEATASTSYTTLTTPDRVSSITLPSGGLLFIAYQAMWKTSAIADTAYAGIFLGSDQLKAAFYGAAAPATSNPEAYLGGAGMGGDSGVYAPLASYSGGLRAAKPVSGFAYTGDVTTGQLVGVPTTAAPGVRESTEVLGWYGFCTVFAAAGTYNVSVQFKAPSANTITVKNRSLWVWSMGFD